MRRNTFETLQAGRAVAAIAVLIHHAADYLGGDPRFWRVSSYTRTFSGGAIGVEFFFVLSGIVILLAHWNDQGHPGKLPTYICKRFRRIYPIYWIVLALVAGPYLVNRHLGHGFERDPWILISSLFLVHINSVETTLHVGWTLFHEVLFYALFALVLLNKRVGYSVGTAWILGSALMLAGVRLNRWGAYVFSPLHILFALGMVVTWFLKARPKLNWIVPLITGCILVSWILLTSARYGSITTPQSMLAGIGSALMLLGVMEAERRGKLKVWPWLVGLGDASYSIYLVHFPVLSVGARQFFRFSQLVHLPLWVWLLSNSAVALLVGILFHHLIEKQILRWLAGASPAKQALTLQSVG